ncbi:hypothetical protein D3C77_797960 [compost metagenome]
MNELTMSQVRHPAPDHRPAGRGHLQQPLLCFGPQVGQRRAQQPDQAGTGDEVKQRGHGVAPE